MLHEGIIERDGELRRSDELALRTLSVRESELADQASEAQKMLAADGSTIVLLTIMDATREDMINVSELLAKLNCGPYVQSLERAIEENLEDMIRAIQQEQHRRDEEEQDDDGDGDGDGDGDDQPLIPLSAELKMLRALQLRINHRTVQVDRARDQLDEAEFAEQTDKLASRQARVSGLTKELSAKLQAERAARQPQGPAPLW